MEPTIVCDSADREHWLIDRMTGLGSSDAPAILGLEKAWGSPFAISCLKRGIRLDEPDQEDELLKWGHYVEAPMIQAFSDETGHEGRLSGVMFRSGDPGLDMMLATLDGVVTEKGGKSGGIECKLVVYTTLEWETEGIPEHVLCQMQHTMAVMDWDFMYVLGLLDGYRLRFKRIERAPDVIGDIIIPAERSFWTRLQAGEEFDAGEGRPDQSAGFLKHLHPDDNGSTVSLPGDDFIKVFDAWEVAKEDAKAAKRRQDQAKNTLVQAIGDATFGVLDDHRRLSLKTTDRASSVSKASTFRVLRAPKK